MLMVWETCVYTHMHRQKRQYTQIDRGEETTEYINSQTVLESLEKGNKKETTAVRV